MAFSLQAWRDALKERLVDWRARWVALRDELARLGNLDRYRAVLVGPGAFAQGDQAQAVGQRGVLARDVGGDVVTGEVANLRGSQGAVYKPSGPADQQFGDRHYYAADGTPPTDPDELRHCYLHRLYERVRRVALSGIDPEAASKAEARLNLGAVYTALRTLTREECDRLAWAKDGSRRPAEGQARRGLPDAPRVLRGGAFNDYTWGVRCAARYRGHRVFVGRFSITDTGAPLHGQYRAKIGTTYPRTAISQGTCPTWCHFRQSLL